MNDGSTGESRSWIERLSHFLLGEPYDREDLIQVLRDAQKRNLIDPDVLAMIEGVLQVNELQVRDIMIPRARMIVVPYDATLDEVLPTVIEAAHSRVPVIAEDRSEVVGILLVKDLLAQMRGCSHRLVSEIMRAAHYVPESKRLNVLLRELRARRSHMAIVVDEFGAAAGLVTIEDILEQIVGDIEDEHDLDEETYIFRRDENEFTVKALTPIEDFNEYFDADYSDEQVDTVGGLIVQHLGYLPKRGEIVEMPPFRFEVLRVDHRRIHLLRAVLIEPFADSREPVGEG